MRKDLEAARDQQIVELIHKNTLRILEEIGIAFLSDSALDLLRQNGVRVEGNRAYFTEKQVMDAMDAAGITYGVDGDVIIISYDATHDGLQYTLDGKINCNVECNPLQAEFAADVIQKLEAGEAIDPVTVVVDQAFVAPGITSQYATTMTQEVLDGRAY